MKYEYFKPTRHENGTLDAIDVIGRRTTIAFISYCTNWAVDIDVDADDMGLYPILKDIYVEAKLRGLMTFDSFDDMPSQVLTFTIDDWDELSEYIANTVLYYNCME